MVLNINPDTVQRLIALAKEFHAQEGVVIPEDASNPSGDWGAQMLAAHAGDATLDEFRSIVADLEPDQLQELVALYWVGREEYSPAEWDEAVAAVGESEIPPVADYLLGHPLLAAHLAAGLDAVERQSD